MTGPDGPLVTTDEWFNHQIVETHAHVAEADRSWTEKVCAMAAARDGSLQLGFGVGKYVNRNVFDGYAGASRGREQWTVRASRRLGSDLETLGVGPIRYEIVEPMRTIRFRCDANDAQPIAFDWTFEGVVPPVLENRHRDRSPRGFRIDSDLLRYHQTGVASGWVELDGVRTEITPDSWVSTRDHSWGIRQGVGVPERDVESGGLVEGVAFRFHWSPMLLEREDGTRYAIHHQFREMRAPAFGYEQRHFEGGVEQADGRIERFASLRPELRYDPVNRRVLGGPLHFTMSDGSERTIEVEALGDTGFHLGAGLYFGLDGHYHGEWRGDLHVEGDHVPDCTTVDAARHLHQIRDALLAVSDPVGGGQGWCNFQTTVYGAWPELGFDDDSSFI